MTSHEQSKGFVDAAGSLESGAPEFIGLAAQCHNDWKPQLILFMLEIWLVFGAMRWLEGKSGKAQP